LDVVSGSKVKKTRRGDSGSIEARKRGDPIEKKKKGEEKDKMSFSR